MSTINPKKHAAIKRLFSLTSCNIHNDRSMHGQFWVAQGYGREASRILVQSTEKF